MIGPPRSMEATNAAEAAAVADARRALPNGLWGLLLFTATEGALFGTLIASYFYLRLQTTQWPPAGIDAPAVALPLILTAVLVSTSVPMLLAARAAMAGRRTAAALLVLAAVVVQTGYLGAQIVSYISDLEKFSPDGTAYGSVYFTMLAFHHAHVGVGLLLDLWVLSRLASGLTHYRVVTVRVAAWYSHFVNAVAIAVVLTQISPS